MAVYQAIADNHPASKKSQRVGSRPWLLVNMAVGDTLIFESHVKGQVANLMQQIMTDILRNGLRGKIKQSHLIAVQPTTKEVYDLVRVERIAE